MDVLSWCNSNNLSLNVSKTKLMYISFRHKQLSMTNDETSINSCDSKIIPTSVGKLLGVTIYNSLCWDNHINQVLKKCNSFLLSRINIILSMEKLTLSYNAYILPHLDYCCIIWDNCTSSVEDKIVKFQKQAASLIY